ncbi:hypothetical protein AGLY_010066 [Aphis glycines]|uniref:Uncharacterized protein n=1 Tax=Aphis glycines TaxID=307491 RepID=A0A6G0TH54_APHGL|nr:hypothetical protein AGLY_010066 [Aphis glycines]
MENAKKPINILKPNVDAPEHENFVLNLQALGYPVDAFLSTYLKSKVLSSSNNEISNMRYTNIKYDVVVKNGNGNVKKKTSRKGEKIGFRWKKKKNNLLDIWTGRSTPPVVVGLIYDEMLQPVTTVSQFFEKPVQIVCIDAKMRNNLFLKLIFNPIRVISGFRSQLNIFGVLYGGQK